MCALRGRCVVMSEALPVAASVRDIPIATQDAMILRTWGAACCAPTRTCRSSAGPEGAVVPVDAVAAVGHDAVDDGAGPICGELAARIPGAGCSGVGFVRDRVRIAATANGTALRTIPAAIPRALDSRTAPAAATAAVVAAGPKGAVRPIDLRTV